MSAAAAATQRQHDENGGERRELADDGASSNGAAPASVDGEEEGEGDAYNYFYYLSPRAARHIPRFEYSGKDLSLLYKYALSPLAEFCVRRFTPRTVAPNTVTSVGLSFMAFAYSVMWYYVPNMVPRTEEAVLLRNDGGTGRSTNDDSSSLSSPPPPRWIFLANAVCILLYQTLDNMDGKQARRTGTSSPLGLLFDHGCDAVNSVFGSANWMIAMALHPRADALLCWIVLFGPYALFYVGTWEEYHTGTLIMPIMNGPNEYVALGIVLVWLVAVVLTATFSHVSLSCLFLSICNIVVIVAAIEEA